MHGDRCRSGAGGCRGPVNRLKRARTDRSGSGRGRGRGKERGWGSAHRDVRHGGGQGGSRGRRSHRVEPAGGPIRRRRVGQHGSVPQLGGRPLGTPGPHPSVRRRRPGRRIGGRDPRGGPIEDRVRCAPARFSGRGEALRVAAIRANARRAATPPSCARFGRTRSTPAGGRRLSTSAGSDSASGRNSGPGRSPIARTGLVEDRGGDGIGGTTLDLPLGVMSTMPLLADRAHSRPDVVIGRESKVDESRGTPR